MISTASSRLLIVGLSIAMIAVTVSGQNPAKKSPPKKSSATPGSSMTVTIPAIKFEKYTLPNGLVVILSEDHRLPLVSTNIWYHVGPANELPGRTGFAHLFEHMMFEGSKHVPGNGHIRYMEAGGIRSERHHRFRSHELFRDPSVESAGTRSVAGIGPHGLSSRPTGSGQPDQPAGRCAQRAPPEHREQPLWHRRGSRLSQSFSQASSVLCGCDGFPRGYSGGKARRCAQFLQALLRSE